jgi:aspartate carbamoyltransferase catalytic subunit
MFKHLLGLRNVGREEILTVLDTARGMKEVLGRRIKKVPTLRGRIVVLLFFEPSTRTRVSFELAAKALSADTVSITAAASSVAKGESLRDTVRTLTAMGADLLVIRHPASGAAEAAARATTAAVINAGDGTHEHPTQALLDLFTMREAKGRLEGLTVTIVGDIRHSRVARSNVWALRAVGAEVRLAGPATLLPPEAAALGIPCYTTLDEALEGADVVMALRLQLERMRANYLPSLREYTRLYCITRERLARAKPDVLLMHPGPVNRGVELAPDLVENAPSVIEEQVTNGVAVRMALLYLMLGGE